MIQVCPGGWNSPWRPEWECSSLICADLTKCQSVLLRSWVIPVLHLHAHRLLVFCLFGVFLVWVFFQEILISLNKIRYSLVQQQNCVHDVLQWTKIWCYHRPEKSIMYAYFPSLKLELFMWKMAENCLGVGGVQAGGLFWLKNVSFFFSVAENCI